MLKVKKILFQIENNIDTVLSGDSILGNDLWNILLQQHNADIAMLVLRLDVQRQEALFKKLPHEIAFKVFRKIPAPLQAELLILLDQVYAAIVMKNMPADELTDLFDHLSDQDLEKYLKLLQANQRHQIISLLNFNPHSAGGRMNSNVFTLQKDFTVKKSIELLQRIGPHRDVLPQIFVTNKDNVLIGHITLDRLVLSKPETPLASIINKNVLHVYVDEDQEDVANQMHHYGLLYSPVVDNQKHFLGVITADDVFEIIKEEGSEDVYRMFGLVPIEYSYFATSIWKLVWQRGRWLVGLLVLQSVSSIVLAHYGSMLNQYTIIAVFLTMLIGTGGNAGSQSATLVIRGLTTKEITRRNARKVLLRELIVGAFIASILTTIAFVRVYFSCHDLLSSIAIVTSLFFIVITSMLLGSVIPMILERFDIDPAHSAAPFLSTLMDILGVIIYCFVCSKILG